MTLEQALADRYAIERELGRGGTLGPERFQREIRLAARRCSGS